jgi:hypothetical protein
LAAVGLAEEVMVAMEMIQRFQQLHPLVEAEEEAVLVLSTEQVAVRVAVALMKEALEVHAQ